MVAVQAYTMRAGITRALRRNHLAKAVLVVLALVVVAGVFAPLLAPADPNAQDLLVRLRPPSWLPGGAAGHPLGTDRLGRDVASRVLYGTRVSLLVGVSAALLAGLIGATIGLVTGLYGGWRDKLFMRIADVQLAFPPILLALAIVAFLGSGLWYVVLVLGITGWVSYARVVRAEVLSLRESDFVVAARAAGASNLSIMRRHLLPNVAAPLATIGTLHVASAILAEAALSYLGLGVPPETPTWGGMLSDGQLYLGTAWWIAIFPGCAIMLTTVAINLAGDLLRDVADPKAYLS